MTLDSLATRVHGRMKADVISCELAPGSFHTEAELAERYGASKTPVRFALTLLSSENLAHVLPRRGIQIAPLALSDLRDTYALRGLLEPFASSMAAKHRTDAQLKRMSEILNELRSDGHHRLTREQIRAHSEFHITIGEASGMSQLAQLIRTLHEAMQRVFNSAPSLGHVVKFGDLDAELLDALGRGDSASAEDLTRRGIRLSNNFTTTALLGDSHPGPADGESPAPRSERERGSRP